MDIWHPRAQQVTPADGHTGLDFVGAPWKIVLHTTETDTYTPTQSSYFGNPFWPHATLTQDTIYQHLPIDLGGYALYADGTVETNRANAVQCEIVWRAANPDWPDGLLATVADWVGWVQAQTGVPTNFAEMWRAGVVLASVDSPIRFGRQEWLDFNGICGHSDVPGGNDHWDPGPLPVDRLRALLGDHKPPDPPTRKKAPDMFLFNHGGGVWLHCGDSTLTLLSTPQVEAMLSAGVPSIGDVTDDQFAQITGKAPGQ